MTRSSIAIVGVGRLGRALAISLRAAGYEITELVFRRMSSPARSWARSVGAEPVIDENAVLETDIVWFCVPDAQIAIAARQLSKRNWKGKFALHSSGVLTSDVLAVLRNKGARVASVHPLMTFVKEQPPDLTGVAFAIEGDSEAGVIASAIARALGGKPVRIAACDKVAYHAFATMVCPLLISLLAASEKVAALAGISPADARRRTLPIIRQTIANYEKLGAAKSFSGPIVRGDVRTIEQHLKVLAEIPELRDVYRALAEAAIKNLPHRNAAAVRGLLRGDSSRRPAAQSKSFDREGAKINSRVARRSVKRIRLASRRSADRK